MVEIQMSVLPALRVENASSVPSGATAGSRWSPASWTTGLWTSVETFTAHRSKFPSRSVAKNTREPSLSQAGSSSRPAPPARSCFEVPSEFIARMSRSALQAISLPSGDQAGPLSAAAVFVRRRSEFVGISSV